MKWFATLRKHPVWLMLPNASEKAIFVNFISTSPIKGVSFSLYFSLGCPAMWLFLLSKHIILAVSMLFSFLLKKKKSNYYSFLFYVNVWMLACMYSVQRPWKGVLSPWAGVSGSFELLDVGAGTWTHIPWNSSPWEICVCHLSSPDNPLLIFIDHSE